MASRVGGLATLILRIGVAEDHLRSDRVKCGKEPHDSELPFTNKVTGRSGI